MGTQPWTGVSTCFSKCFGFLYLKAVWLANIKSLQKNPLDYEEIYFLTQGFRKWSWLDLAFLNKHRHVKRQLYLLK